MNNPMAVGLAREQLRELIAILGELRNAGPRDQSFKQWRQVTLTLLQRIWPGEQARAATFRNILFSAPTARSDPNATREYYERGCSEASAYLEGLALELETAPAPGGSAGAGAAARSDLRRVEPAAGDFSVPGEVSVPASPTGERAAPAETSPRVASPPPPSPTATPRAPTPGLALPWAPGTKARPVPPPPPSPEPTRAEAPPHPIPEAVTPPPHARPRLKDMLGFGDEGISAPTARGAPGVPPPPAPAASVPAAPPAPAATPPQPAAPIAPPPAPVGRRPSPATPAPSPPASLIPRTASHEPAPGRWAAGGDSGIGPELDAQSELEAALEELQDRSSHAHPRAPRSATPALAAREVLAMAAGVEALGVPGPGRAIVRAALIDLGRQMDSPPVNWTAIRQALSFAMDHPQLARRLIPLLLPYLDEAA